MSEPGTTRDPENIMRQIWDQYRADNPDVEAWDDMSETERKVMRSLALAAGRLK